MPQFSSLSADELPSIAALVSIEVAPPGAPILRRGEPASAFFLLVCGRVLVQKSLRRRQESGVAQTQSGREEAEASSQGR